MSAIIKAAMLTLFAVTLTGCGLFTQVEYVDKYVYVTKYRTISDEYLQFCPVVEPPSPERYMASTPNRRVDMWIKVYTDQIHKTNLRNVKLQELIELNRYLDEQYNQNVEVAEDEP